LLDVDALHDLGDAGHLGGEAHGVVALLVVLENAGQRDDTAARDVDGGSPVVITR
jgi:hypothetical protein